MHLAVELPWSDNGWCGKVCAHPELNWSCRAWSIIRSRIDLELEEQLKDRVWALTKDRPQRGDQTSERNYRLPCWAFVNTFGAQPVPFVPEVHKNVFPRVGSEVKPIKFQRVRGYSLPPYSMACVPWLQMLARGSVSSKWLKNPSREKRRLDEFWRQFRSDHDLVFFYCRKGHPHDSDLPILPVGVCLLHGVEKIAKGVHPSERARYPIWERAVTHGFPERGYRIPWHGKDQHSLEQALAVLKKQSQVVIPIQHPVVAMSSVELLPWIERLLSVADNAPRDSEWGSVEWLSAAHRAVQSEQECYPSLGAVLAAMKVRQPFEKAVEAERAGRDLSVDPWETAQQHMQPATSACPYRFRLRQAYDEDDPVSRRRVALGIILSQFVLPDDQVWKLLRKNKKLPTRLSKLAQNPYWLCHRETARSWGLSEPVAPAAIDVVRDERGKGRLATRWLDLDPAQVFGHALAKLNFATKQGHAFLPMDREFLSPKRQEQLRGLALSMRSEVCPLTIRQLAAGGEAVALRAEHDAEAELAKTLVALANTEAPLCIYPGDDNAIHIAKGQLKPRGVAVITGPAGTGKSHAIRELYAQLRGRGKETVVVAPTGRAAKLLREPRGGEEGIPEAQTLHSLLADKHWFSRKKFRRTGRPHSAECLIVDEASMLSNEQLLTLLRACGELRFLCLVGDPEQLEPIGVGRPFSLICDWIAKNYTSQFISLEDTHGDRAGAVNLIAMAARDKATPSQLAELRRSLESPEPVTSLGETIELCRWSNPEELQRWLAAALEHEAKRSRTNAAYRPKGLSISNDLLWPRSINEESGAFSWQILSPRRTGSGGVETLNVMVQKMLFTAEHSKRLAEHGSKFFLGRINREEKVVWKTNARHSLFDRAGLPIGSEQVVNGTLGVVLSPKGVRTREYLFVQCSECFYGFVAIPRNEVDKHLELGYATTVHKAQGSGFHTVVLVLSSSDHAIAKRLLYTATTRHKSKLLILLGVPSDGSNPAGTLKALIDNPSSAFLAAERHTLLGELLEAHEAEKRGKN